VCIYDCMSMQDAYMDIIYNIICTCTCEYILYLYYHVLHHNLHDVYIHICVCALELAIYV
jgi:hypothetical protein